HVPQACDHLVAERTRGKNRVRLDQDDLEPRINTFQEPRRRGAPESATEHDDAGLYALCEQWKRKGSRDRAGSSSRAELPPGGALFAHGRQLGINHGCVMNQVAIALISSSEKPLAMRSITVAGRRPSR